MTGKTRMMYSTLSNYDYEEDNNMSGGNNNNNNNNDEDQGNEHLRPHPSPTGQVAAAAAAAGSGGTISVVANVVENNENDDEQQQRRHRRRTLVGRGRNLLNKVFATKKRRSGSRSSDARNANGTTDCMVKEDGQDTAAANSCVGKRVDVEKNNLDESFFVVTNEDKTINTSYSSSKSSSNCLSSPTKTVDVSADSGTGTGTGTGSSHSPWIFQHNDESHESINFFQGQSPHHLSFNNDDDGGATTFRPTFPVVQQTTTFTEESAMAPARPGQCAGQEEEEEAEEEVEPATNSISIVPPPPITTGTDHQQRKESMAEAFDPFETSFVTEEEKAETDLGVERTTNENHDVGDQHQQPREVVVYTEDNLHKYHQSSEPPQHTVSEQQQGGGGRSLYKKTMSMKQTVRGLLVSRRKTSDHSSKSSSHEMAEDDTAKDRQANELSELTSEEQKLDNSEENRPHHQYVIRMESRIRSREQSLIDPPSSNTQSNSSSSGFMACTGDISDAVKNVAFDDDVLDAIEGSQVELNHMVRKISRVTSEPMLATMSSCGTPSPEGTATPMVPSEESTISYTPTWQKSMSNKWNSFVTKTTSEDRRKSAKVATGHEDEKEDPYASSLPDEEDLGYIPKRYSMVVDEPVKRSSSRGRKQPMTTTSEPSNPAETSFIGEVTNFFGSVNDGLVSIADDVKKTDWLDPNTMMEFVDCLNPNPTNVNDVVSEDKKFPLDDSWLSTNNDSDSISKLTNPQELERSEMSSLSGIPRLENPTYDF